MKFASGVFSFLLLTALSTAFSEPAMSAPGPVLQGADTYSFLVGDVKVTALSDGSVPLDVHELLRGTSKEKIEAALDHACQTNPIEASVNAFLFRLGDHLVLVDTGSGEFFGTAFGDKLVSSLAAAGVKPEQITDILVTHAHADHMGGLVHGGKLTFPNALVHIAKADVDFFLDNSNSARTGYPMQFFDKAEVALKPCMDAHKLAPFAADGEILPGVSAAIHPGHTPGSTFYTLSSKEQSLIFIGDTVHICAVQTADPAVTITFDLDSTKAADVRKTAFSSFADHRTLVAVPHFSFPGVGYLRRSGTGFDWVPVTYANRDATQK